MKASHFLPLPAIAALTLVASTATPQSASRFEILGVRIGMDAGEAVSTLRTAGLFRGNPQESRFGCAAQLRGASPAQRIQSRNRRTSRCIENIRWEGPEFAIDLSLIEDLPDHPDRSVVHRIGLSQRAVLSRENIRVYWSALETKYGKASEFSGGGASWREPGRNTMLLFTFIRQEGQADSFGLSLYDFDFTTQKTAAFVAATEVEEPRVRPRF